MVNTFRLDTACIIFGLVLVSFINLCVTLMQKIVKMNGPSLVKGVLCIVMNMTLFRFYFLVIVVFLSPGIWHYT